MACMIDRGCLCVHVCSSVVSYIHLISYFENVVYMSILISYFENVVYISYLILIHHEILIVYTKG